MAGKWVGQNRLVVVTWRADDGAEFATGFLPRSPRRPRSWSTPSSGTSRGSRQRPRQQHPLTAARHPARSPPRTETSERRERPPRAQPSQQQSWLVEREPAVLVLEDGRTFRGESYGARRRDRRRGGLLHRHDRLPGDADRPELPPAGRRETAPHIGNTGVNDEDDESRRIWVAGYVVRDPALRPSNWRSGARLEDDLRRRRASSASAASTPAR